MGRWPDDKRIASAIILLLVLLLPLHSGFIITGALVAASAKWGDEDHLTLPGGGPDEMRGVKPPAPCPVGLQGVSLPRRASVARAGGLAWQEALPQPPGCAGSGWEGGTGREGTSV